MSTRSLTKGLIVGLSLFVFLAACHPKDEPFTPEMLKSMVKIAPDYICGGEDKIEFLTAVYDAGIKNGVEDSNEMITKAVRDNLCNWINYPGTIATVYFNKVVTKFATPINGQIVLLVETWGNQGQKHYSLWFEANLERELKKNKKKVDPASDVKPKQEFYGRRIEV